MAFKKTFSSQEMEPIGEKFPKGCQFIRDEKKWTVTKSFTEDNTSWRRMVANDGTDEVVMLSTLEKDIAEGSISFIEPTDDVGIELAKRDAELAKVAKEEAEEADAPIEIDLEKEEHKFKKKF